jgi:hypothetical protein
MAATNKPLELGMSNLVWRILVYDSHNATITGEIYFGNIWGLFVYLIYIFIEYIIYLYRGKWSEVMILGEMCVISMIYNYVAVGRFCAVRCIIIIICCCLLYSNYLSYVF